MNRQSFVLKLTLTAAAVLALAGPATAGKQVPFKGRLAGTVTVTPVTPPAIVDVLVDATGNATHLGKFTLQVPHRVDRSQTPPAAVGTYEFTAANGDLLEAEFTGQSMLLAPGLLYIVETGEITGGTGRFANASGSFVCERWFDTAAGTTVGEFEGTISSVGGK